LSSFVCLVSGVSTAGCATKRPQPFDQAALRASRPLTLVVADSRSPAMTAEGPDKEGRQGAYMFGAVGGMFGAVGGALGGVIVATNAQTANRKRARWMKGCGIDDPVVEIRDTVAESFAQALSLHVLESDRMTKSEAAKDVINDYPGADLILDIRTSRWGIHRIEAPSPNKLVHFAVGYDGSIRLIDARTRAVIAESTCSVQYSNGDDPPTMNELLEDDCALLDKGLALSADTCVKRHLRALRLE